MGFYKYLKGMEFEGKVSCSFQYMKDVECKLRRDIEPTRDRGLQWFSSLLNTINKSPVPDPDIVEEPKVMSDDVSGASENPSAWYVVIAIPRMNLSLQATRISTA